MKHNITRILPNFISTLHKKLGFQNYINHKVKTPEVFTKNFLLGVISIGNFFLFWNIQVS